MTDENVMHLKTQRGQPYGSQRRCCEECGRMIWDVNGPWNKDTPNHRWTDDPDIFSSATEHGFRRCTDKPAAAAESH